MAQDCRLCIGARHTAPVVRHADETDAAAHNLNLNRRCARVHRVLDQLLHDGGGALDDLPRRNLVDGSIIQYVNLRHASPASFRACSCRR